MQAGAAIRRVRQLVADGPWRHLPPVRFRPMLRIRTQIILPFLLLMLILGVVGTYLTTSLVATSLENRIGDQLGHAEDAALDAAVKLQGRQVAAIRLFANTEGVDRAVAAGDVAALRPPSGRDTVC